MQSAVYSLLCASFLLGGDGGEVAGQYYLGQAGAMLVVVSGTPPEALCLVGSDLTSWEKQWDIKSDEHYIVWAPPNRYLTADNNGNVSLTEVKDGFSNWHFENVRGVGDGDSLECIIVNDK